MALAGGVALSVPQKAGYLYQEGGILSPDGHCRAFDARAAGTVGGNGVGIVVLKRLADALADGDTIHAVIKGSAINNDGSGKVGYTAPSVDGQAEVIAAGAGAGGVSTRRRSATSRRTAPARALGDPIEIAGADPGVPDADRDDGLLRIGSVKTNIGHLDTAAGVAA